MAAVHFEQVQRFILAKKFGGVRDILNSTLPLGPEMRPPSFS